MTSDVQPKLQDGNTILGDPILQNSEIAFTGKNNILYCEDNVRIVNSKISFQGDNCVVFLSSNRHTYYLNISIYNNSVCYFGRDNYFNGPVNIILSEQKHLVVGNDGLFSFDIWIRTADPHLIYDVATGKRINSSKSVFLGDHVWIGQHAMILKGTKIGSGSIVGAMSLVSGKTIESNACYGGNPVKQLAEDVFFTKDCVHAYRKKQTKKHSSFEGQDFIYSPIAAESISFTEIEKNLNGLASSEEKLQYLKDVLSMERKNRFYIKKSKKKRKLFSKIIKKCRGWVKKDKGRK